MPLHTASLRSEAFTLPNVHEAGYSLSCRESFRSASMLSGRRRAIIWTCGTAWTRMATGECMQSRVKAVTLAHSRLRGRRHSTVCTTIKASVDESPLIGMGSSFPTSTLSSASTTCCRPSVARRESTRRSSSCRCVRISSRRQELTVVWARLKGSASGGAGQQNRRRRH